MSEPPSNELIAFAGRLADLSRPILRRYFRSRLAVEDKADFSPVTAADREAEAAMRTAIEAAYPDHGILGEEYGSVRTDAEHVWVLDPLDGTKAFTTGKPLFGTLIALAHRGRPVLGVLDAAALQERWVGCDGMATTLDGAPCRARACAAPDQAILNATSPDMFEGADAAAFARARARVKATHFGGDCYAYGLVAAGFLDAVVEARLKPYDYMALVPIVQGAGGVVTDWAGAPLHLGSDGRVVMAGDARVHAAIVSALAG